MEMQSNREKIINAIRKELGKLPKTVNVRDLLAINNDEEFIKQCYLLILQRPPDEEGFNHFLDSLKKGIVSREDIILALRFSNEGEIKGVILEGLDNNLQKKLLLHLKKLKKLKNFIEKVSLFRIKRKLNKLKNLMLFPKKISELQEELEALKNSIDRLYSNNISYPFLSDKEYLKFEDAFRGSKDKVKQQQKLYFKFIEDLNRDSICIDLGCGRGEWLEILKEKGLKPIGVDINWCVIENLKEQGFKVINQDIFEFLKSQKNNTIDLITAFHIIEHIKPELRIKFLKEIQRVLKPNGLAIIETPNPRNILVGSGEFYRDPTHILPVFPDTLQFLGELVGFKNSQSYFIDYENNNFIKIDDYKFNDLQSYIEVSRDFAWIGKK